MKSQTDAAGRIPPQALDFEESILGALMLEQDAMHKVSGIINQDSFYLDKHRTIFRAIKSLSDFNIPIDLITVTKALKDSGDLESVGGPPFFTDLTRNVASAAHIEYHAHIIAQQCIKRDLIKISTETIKDAYEEATDIEDLITTVKQKISAVEDRSLGTNTGQSHECVMEETIIEIEKDCILSQQGKQPGITTGIKTLNNATGGWRATNLIIIAARPGVGKTSLALHFVKMAALSGKWVNFYGFEMKSTDLMRIMIAAESGVNRLKLRDGLLADKDWDMINAMADFEKLPILWNDNAGQTSSAIKSNTIKNRKKGKCDLVIIDYLQLVKPYDKKAIREQQVSEISRTLKEIALSENIPVICLSQLNRAAANDKPELQHLRESGAIEQDADIVLFPWKNEADHKFYISIAKNRRGITGDFEILANPEMTIFSDVSHNEFNCIPETKSEW